MLLSASVAFYGFWNFLFVPLLFVSIGVDYVAARLISTSRNAVHRRLALVTSLAVNFCLLGFFKYFYFFIDNFALGMSAIGVSFDLPVWTILLPIGISFYTFQSVSYTIDVYRRTQKPVCDFVLFANYVTFFPQLVAGPILRAGEVIWQLDNRPAIDWEDIQSGALRIIGGLALKVLVADNIAPSVNQGFAMDPSELSAIDVTTLGFLFGFQIYFDFAAYSHIALGSAKMMGIVFPENFNFPYSARSPKDFWRRWHISLSSWIRDYLYLPLLGTQPLTHSTGGIAQTRIGVNRRRATFALIATWAIMGLWHGAAWSFVVWGLWHAALILCHRELIRAIVGHALPTPLLWTGSAVSFFLIMLSWIPFRADGLNATFAMLGAFVDPERWLYFGMRENTYLIAFLVFVIVMLGPPFWRAAAALDRRRQALPARITIWTAATVTLAAVLVYLRPLEQFIYFQF